MRHHSKSVLSERDLSTRKHLMARSFADAANNHGFKRSRWRGLERVSIQDFLIAAVQNIRILIAKGRKPTGVAQEAWQRLISKQQMSSIMGDCCMKLTDLLMNLTQIRPLPVFQHDSMSS